MCSSQTCKQSAQRLIAVIFSPFTGSRSPQSPSLSQAEDPGGSTSSSNSGVSFVNLTREYSLAVQTYSYNEIWATIHAEDQLQIAAADVVQQVLHPDQASVQQALLQARSSSLIYLISTYFDRSEQTSHMCLLLHRSIHRAQTMYQPVGNLIEILPLEQLTQTHCDQAFAILTELDLHENPFPSDSIFGDMRQFFSGLKLQLDHHLQKAHKRVCFVHQLINCSTVIFIGISVAIFIFVVVIAVHALPALVAIPLLTLLPTHIVKKQQDHIALLEAAAKGTYVLNNDLDTIDRLVARLYAAIESDKQLVRLAYGRGREGFPVYEVIKQIRTNYTSFLHHLEDLEEHICLCFATVNRARWLLLQEILLH